MVNIFVFICGFINFSCSVLNHREDIFDKADMGHSFFA